MTKWRERNKIFARIIATNAFLVTRHSQLVVLSLRSTLNRFNIVCTKIDSIVSIYVSCLRKVSKES